MNLMIRNLIFIPITIVTGGMLGLILNAVSIAFCPLYFDLCLEPSYPAIGTALDGLLIGFRDGMLVSSAVSLLVLGYCRMLHWRQFVLIAGSVIAGYLLGGLAGISYAWLAPAMFEEEFRFMSGATDQILSCAWVGGSIPGMIFGALFGAIGVIGCNLELRHENLPQRSRLKFALLWLFGGLLGLHWIYIGRWKLALLQVLLLPLLFFGVFGKLIGLSTILLLWLLARLPRRDCWNRAMTAINSGNIFQTTVISIVLLGIALLLSGPCCPRQPERMREGRCRSDLVRIYTAIIIYQANHHATMPTAWSDLELKGELYDPAPAIYRFFERNPDCASPSPIVYTDCYPPLLQGTMVLWSDGKITHHFGKHYHGRFQDESELWHAIQRDFHQQP